MQQSSNIGSSNGSVTLLAASTAHQEQAMAPAVMSKSSHADRAALLGRSQTSSHVSIAPNIANRNQPPHRSTASHNLRQHRSALERYACHPTTAGHVNLRMMMNCLCSYGPHVAVARFIGNPVALQGPKSDAGHPALGSESTFTQHTNVHR